ncbi:MAG: hypothetical protein WEB90_05340 [Gemmatimonadota bacterium]
MVATRVKGAILALVLHVATVIAVPLAEPSHAHQGAAEAQWHAKNDLCESPTPLDQCALLRHTQAKALPSTADTGLVVPVPNGFRAPSATRQAPKGHAATEFLPRGPPAT